MYRVIRNLVKVGGGLSVFIEQDMCTIVDNWEASGVKEEDCQYLVDWCNDRAKRRTTLPDGTEWTPGFDDCDAIVWGFGAYGKGAKLCYPNRLARSPLEGVKVKALLEVLPLWEQDIA